MEPLFKSTSCTFGILPNVECLSGEEPIVHRLHQDGDQDERGFV